MRITSLELNLRDSTLSCWLVCQTPEDVAYLIDVLNIAHDALVRMRALQPKKPNLRAIPPKEPA